MVFWNAIAGFAQGWIGSDAFSAAVDANNRISDTNAKARNAVRQASNLAQAAQNNLARWVQSVNNNRILDSGGEQIEANIVNYRRSNDAMTSQSFSQTIREAEQAGASAAAQAAAGIEGNVVDMVNGSTALRDSIIRQQMDDMGATMANDAAKRAGQIMTSTVQGLDGSLIMDALDYNIDVPVVQHKFSRFQQGLFGMIKHMGGVSSDPSPNQSEDRSKQYEAEKKENMDFAESRERPKGYRLDATGTRSFEDMASNFGNGTNDYTTDKKFSWETKEDPYKLWGADRSSSTGDSGNNNYFSW